MKRKTPARRKSQRYLSIRIHSDQEVKFGELLDAVKNSTREYMGLKELSEAQPWLIKNKFDLEQQEAVLRVNRDFVDDIRASLLLVEGFSGKEGFIGVSKVSGSISGL